MGGVQNQVTLDDDFVLQQLRPVSERWPALSVEPGRMAQVRKRVEREIGRCLTAFRKHHGVSGQQRRPPHVQKEEDLLIPALKILGRVLRLEKRIPDFRLLVEADWLAHVELAKEKRYRDHITHPVRVTAIGWWFLHAERGRMLAKLAKHYEAQTADYRAASDVDLEGKSWKAIVEYAWLACGLLHDSAYPLEYHLRSRQRLGGGFRQVLEAVTGMTKVRAPTQACEVLLDPLRGSWLDSQSLDLSGRVTDLCKGEVKHCHALLGALHHLPALQQQLHSLQGLVVQLAARSIVSHHDEEDKAITSDPLALLLHAADTLQAWERPFLHREDLPTPDSRRTIRTLVECERMVLAPHGPGCLVEFWMNGEPEDMALLKKAPYKWRLDKFREPNRRLERLTRRRGSLLPPLIVSQTRCVQPREFRSFMKS